MKKDQFSNIVLIFLLGFLSLGAFYGSITLIVKPDGSILQMPIELLANSPFKSYLIPGIILVAFFGISPVFIIYGLIKKTDSRFFNRFNLLNDYQFAWTYAVYIGFGQIIWINIQTLMLNSVGIIHTIYSSLGIAIVCIALLPSTRKHYKV